MNHPHTVHDASHAATPARTPSMHSTRRMVPSEVTGAAFPALYLVRSSLLVRWLARLTFLALLVGAIVLIFVPWQQSSRGQGRVTARDPQQRPQPVAATYDGIIKWVKPGLQEGSRVTEDEILIKLEPFAREEVEQVKIQLRQAELKKESAEITVKVSEDNVARQASSGLSEIASEQAGIEAARAKWNQELANLASAKAAYGPVKFDYDSSKRLFETAGTVSGLDVQYAFSKEQAAAQKVIEAEQKVQEAYQTLDAKEQSLEAKRQMVELKNNEAGNKYQADRQKLAEVEKEITELKVKLGGLDRLDVISPRAGIIQQLQINIGSDAVKKGEPLFTVVPEVSELAVELTVPGNDSPLIHVGDEVRLQFQGWPAIQWVGWPSVAVGTFGGRVNSINPSDDGKGDFIVFVTPDLEDKTQEPWPDNRYLRQGVRANGWILLKTVPLGYELWRQLNGFPPIVDPPSGKEDPKKSDDPKKPKLPK